MNRQFQLVFADDLTGAMEIGLQSVPALVINEVENISEFPAYRTLIINTQTRELSFAETQKTTQNALSFILQSKICPQTKVWGYKIDSTLRGEIGAAIDVLRKGMASELVLIAPAIPQTGRITKKGVHYLISNGQEIPVHKTVYGKDLRSFRKTSFIPDLIGAQIGEEVGLISLSTVRKGTEAILDLFSVKKETIVVVDATTEDDLDAIARALIKTDKSVLPVGSAGLFAALYRVSGKGVKGQEGKKAKRQEGKEENEKILFIIGSLNPKTDQQVDFLLSSGKRVKLVELNSSNLLSDDVSRQAEISHARKMIKEAMKDCFHPVLRASRKTNNDQKPDDSVAWALGKTIDDREILSKLRLVLVTGGETALTVTKVLGVSGMTVEGAVEPFVPIGRFVGGKVDNMSVVTKAGGFGTAELLEKLFIFL